MIKRSTKWISNRLASNVDLILLASILVIVLGIWAFAELADEVIEGHTQPIDDRIILALRTPSNPAQPIGPPWLAEIGRDLTALGGIAALAIITAAVAGYLWLAGQRRAFVLVLVATLGGLILSTILKGTFARPRPDIVPHLSYVTSYSFPSGHSMLSAVVYLTLGTLLSLLVKPLRIRLYIISVALMITFLVGISRVYAGVHYPTDVLAGWAAGLTWAMLCWLTGYFTQKYINLKQRDYP